MSNPWTILISDGRAEGPAEELRVRLPSWADATFGAADPFVREDRYVFCEVIDTRLRGTVINRSVSPAEHNDRRRHKGGVIVCVDIRTGDCRLVLRELDTHLSYPNVVEWADGVYYMYPETYQSGECRAYRCIDFPYEWVLERAILKGAYCDPTIVPDPRCDEARVLIVAEVVTSTTFENATPGRLLGFPMLDAVTVNEQRLIDFELPGWRGGGDPTNAGGVVLQHPSEPYGKGVAVLQFTDDLRLIYPQYLSPPEGCTCSHHRSSSSHLRVIDVKYG